MNPRWGPLLREDLYIYDEKFRLREISKGWTHCSCFEDSLPKDRYFVWCLRRGIRDYKRRKKVQVNKLLIGG